MSKLVESLGSLSKQVTFEVMYLSLIYSVLSTGNLECPVMVMT